MHELAEDETFAIGKGEAITNFLKHVKEPVRNYLYEHAPKPDWWREPEDLFEAAHNYELNENAARSKPRSSHADRKEVNNLQARAPIKKWNTYQRGASHSRGRGRYRGRGRGARGPGRGYSYPHVFAPLPHPPPQYNAVYPQPVQAPVSVPAPPPAQHYYSQPPPYYQRFQ